MPDVWGGSAGAQVLANVLANAVKFTTAGEVVVSATCRDAEPGGAGAGGGACSGAQRGVFLFKGCECLGPSCSLTSQKQVVVWLFQ